ncbi:MDR family MFS transporter [Candidatus Protofrankia californiensis]|uniref:MDR family MFS transporter n=1 Tax=Candidatus Protofrankia californiensis TaxID=1839754 RepID=UPI001041331F|nr:MFS transporter [Candidatus Protofrankia californiensis]
MTALVATTRSFDRPVRLLFVNQFSINIGFYMLMPYLAAHLSGELGLAAWLVGLVLGARNLSQQGMFLVGGYLADRLGCKPLIVAGCLLRTVGFALLGVASSLPALLVASAATGLAGALFNPAVRAYLAAEAAERRVEAFAAFNVYYQAGILAGPLVGLLLTGVSFRLTCAVAASIFTVLSVLQLLALPNRPPAPSASATRSVRADWAVVARNRTFLLFAGAMSASYVLSFQIYLALPLHLRQVVGDGAPATAAITAVFVVSGLVAILGQLRLTAWCRRRWDSRRAIVAGVAVMGLAFVPLLVTAAPPLRADPLDATTAGLGDYLVAFATAVLTAALLTLGTAIAYPFEMDTVVVLARDRLVATHYGLYNSVAGVGITLGNLAAGAAFDGAAQAPVLPWVLLVATGLVSAAAIHAVTGRRPATSDSRDGTATGAESRPSSEVSVERS